MCEWMGWSDLKEIDFGGPVKLMGLRTPNAIGLEVADNYLSDDSPRRLLNESEARLTENQYYLFVGYLAKLQDANDTGWFSQKCISATARQRVIAILKVVKPELFQ